MFVEVECSQRMAGIEQMLADFAHGLHVHIEFHTEFLGEDIYQLDSRCSRAAAEPPYIGIEDVDAVDDGHD